MASGVSKVHEARIKEAEAALKAGNSAASTGLFKWKPDWEGAAIEFDKAGNAFAAGKQPERALEAFMQSANAHYECGATFTAAEAVQKAAKAAMDMGDSDRAAQLYQEAVNYYRENGNSDKAATVLIRAAKIVEETNQEAALEMMMTACEMYESEEREIFSHECFKATVSLLLKMEKYAETVDVMRRQVANFQKLEQTDRLFKAYLGIVIVYLAMDDYVAADRAQQEFLAYDGFLHTKECTCANDLLDAFEAGDEEKFADVQKRQVLTFLDQPIVRLAKQLKTGAGPGGTALMAVNDEGEPAEDDDDDIL